MSNYKCPCGNILCPDPGMKTLESKLDRLKAELEKRHEKCKENYDEAIKNRWDAGLDRDLWKSKAEKLAEALRRIEERTLTDRVEGPELRAQNANNYRDAKAALAEFGEGQ